MFRKPVPASRYATLARVLRRRQAGRAAHRQALMLVDLAVRYAEGQSLRDAAAESRRQFESRYQRVGA